MENENPASTPPPVPPVEPPPHPVEPPPVPTATPPPAPTGNSGDEKNLAMFCHLSGILGAIAVNWTGLPIGNILGPLIIWLLKKDTMPLVNEHGKEALNFQITVSIAVGACLMLFFLFLPILLLPVIGIAALVLSIIGTIKASNGILYRYPFTLRLVK